MEYFKAVDEIQKIKGHLLDEELTVLRFIMKQLGDVQDKLKIIHVAGTNGKGSTSAVLSSILMKAGLKVGVFTSPHLVEYTERFTINGCQISKDEFVIYYEKVKNICSKISENNMTMPSIFEVLTIIGFCYFYDMQCDVVIMEVGLGGRFDATNIIKKPLVSVITSISLDHTEILGNDVEKIAFEKAGIIKDNVPTVLYNQDQKIYDVIFDVCKTHTSKLYYSKNVKNNIKKFGYGEMVFDIECDFYKLDDIKTSLVGEHQAKNITLAITVAKVLNELGYNITNENIYDGVECAKWQGRFELIQKENPTIIFDGAHNEDGVKALAQTIKTIGGDKKITLLIGVLSNKDYVKMAEILIPLSHKIVITKPDNYMALDENKLGEICKKYNKEMFICDKLETAFDTAKNITEKDQIIICSGSLYLIGELKKHIDM